MMMTLLTMQTMLRLAEEDSMKAAFCVGGYPAPPLGPGRELSTPLASLSFAPLPVLSKSCCLSGACHVEGPLHLMQTRIGQWPTGHRCRPKVFLN